MTAEIVEGKHPDREEFYNSNVLPAEQILLAHPIAQIFNGDVYTVHDVQLEEFDLHGILLTPADTAKLFCLPDESVFAVKSIQPALDGSLAAVEVRSENAFIQEGEANIILAYAAEDGESVRISEMHVERIMLDNQAAPARFATVAFGLMAVTAYKHGFRRITLFAAGRAPVGPDTPDEMVGFLVWPKFGFDGQVHEAELTDAVHIKDCKTVRDVIDRDPDWWERVGGSGREMEFDLCPGSRSWTILLNYLCDVLL